MISIITVNFNSYDFLNILLESLQIYSSLPHHTIVIDNSENPQKINTVNQIITGFNTGHGTGLNLGVLHALKYYYNDTYIMFLDVDCHILSHRWEIPLIESMKEYDLIGAKGVSAKPIRPACMFMKQEIARNNWDSTEGYRGERITPASENNFDVAISAYHKIIASGKKVGFLETQPNRYGTINGEEYGLNGKPLCYHHWSGTWLKERQKDFPNNDLIEDKNKLFSRIPWHLL
jgi:GT2 family glycosyltransferase